MYGNYALFLYMFSLQKDIHEFVNIVLKRSNATRLAPSTISESFSPKINILFIFQYVLCIYNSENLGNIAEI